MPDLVVWFLAAWHLVVSCPVVMLPLVASFRVPLPVVMPPLVASFPVPFPAVMPPLVASFPAAMPPLESAAVRYPGCLVNPAPRLEAYRCPATIPAGRYLVSRAMQSTLRLEFHWQETTPAMHQAHRLWASTSAHRGFLVFPELVPLKKVCPLLAA